MCGWLRTIEAQGDRWAPGSSRSIGEIARAGTHEPSLVDDREPLHERTARHREPDEVEPRLQVIAHRPVPIERVPAGRHVTVRQHGDLTALDVVQPEVHVRVTGP